MTHRFFLGAALIGFCLAALPAQAQTPVTPATPEMQAAIDKVLTRARKDIGEEFLPGIVLRRAFQHGNIIMIEGAPADRTTASQMAADKPRLQRQIVKALGRDLCRLRASRRFISIGGSVQLVVRNRRGTMLGGGRLTKC